MNARAPNASAVLPPVRREFRQLAATIVPEASRLDDAGWTALEDVVENALDSRPIEMRRQLALLVRILMWLPLLRFGRTFGALDARRRTDFLRAIERSPIVLLRRGFWGLRTLVLMGYWTRSAAADEIGYRPRPGGWSEAR